MDNDAHSLDHGDRENNILNIRSSPICIGDDVFIGARSILLKGVKIGARTIVRAGSVVLGEFPPDCIIGGNPAVIVSTKR
jgi:acetyltransferase-like isoleucine patch superfamily enzyme